jgi:hypothetical protein
LRLRRRFITETSTAPRGIDTPDPRTLGRHIQENEAEQHRQLAFVFERPKTLRKMADELSDGHFAAGDECRIAGEKTEGNYDAENDLMIPARPNRDPSGTGCPPNQPKVFCPPCATNNNPAMIRKMAKA